MDMFKENENHENKITICDVKFPSDSDEDEKIMMKKDFITKETLDFAYKTLIEMGIFE